MAQDELTRDQIVEKFGFDGIHIVDADEVVIAKEALTFSVDGFAAEPTMQSPRLAEFREYYGFSEHLGIEIIRPFKMKIPNNGRVLILGPSGTGKTTILRALRKSPNVVDLDTLIPEGKDAEKPIVELVGNSLDEALSFFASVGLADALALANTYEKLSDGQKYRYLIARALSHEAKVLMADRFFENLDETNCRVIGYLLARKCQQQGKTLIVATIRKRVRDWINANLICSTSLGNAPAIEKREIDIPEKPDFEFTFEGGKLGNVFNQYLGPYHYKSRYAPFPIFTVIARTKDGEVAGGASACSAPLNLRARNENIGIPREWVTSQKVWLMTRVVVRPEYRGVSLGKRLVDEFIERMPGDVKVIEALAAMAKRHPFLENTHFKLREFGAAPTREVFREHGFKGSMSDDELMSHFDTLSEETQSKLLKIPANNRKDKRSLVGLLRTALSEGGIYGYWIRPQLKNEVEYRTGDDKEFRIGKVSAGLPYVLTREAVDNRYMPLLGNSEMPESLMRVTPAEYRFWQAEGTKEARKTRDELVSSGFFTEDNVKIVNGEPRKIITKRFLYEPDSDNASKAVWSTAYINDLPDSAFLYIEPGGEKDEEDKTKPRSLRHWPIRDDEGEIDLPHLRNALARIPQTNVPQEAKDKAIEQARALLEEMKERAQEKLSKNLGRVKLLKTKEERYVLGIVLEPNDGEGDTPLDPDSQLDIYSKADVRASAHRYMEEFQNIGLMHRSLVNGKVKILESFVVPDGTGGFDIEDPKGRKQHVREGTWLLGLRIVDDKLWQRVKDDDLKGLSIGGSARRVSAKT